MLNLYILFSMYCSLPEQIKQNLKGYINPGNNERIEEL
jgi:hypothetical protein